MKENKSEKSLKNANKTNLKENWEIVLFAEFLLLFSAKIFVSGWGSVRDVA